MSAVKVFIASSLAEFEHERTALMNHVRLLNERFFHGGTRVKGIVCEEMPADVWTEQSKQDYLNDAIQGSDIAVFLIGEKVGEYTLKEFEAAYRRKKETGSPRIFIYRRGSGCGREDKSVTALRHLLGDQAKHAFIPLPHIDTVKLQLTIELMGILNMESALKLENGQALYEGASVMSLANIPLYKSALSEKERQRVDLQKKYDALRTRFATDESALKDLYETGQALDKLTEQIEQMEKGLHESYSILAGLGEIGSKASRRERDAANLINQGRILEANDLLRDGSWDDEIKEADAALDALVEQNRKYISGKRTLIANLIALGVTQESSQEIEATYETIVRIAERYGVDLDVLLEYAEYLYDQSSFEKGLTIANRLLSYVALRDDVEKEASASLMLLIAKLEFENKKHRESVRHFTEAIDAYQTLAEEGNQAYEEQLARAYAGLAKVYWYTKDSQAGRPLLEQALVILEPFALKGSVSAKEGLGNVYNQLGTLARLQGDLEAAIAYHTLALEVRGGLESSNSSKYGDALSESHMNYAVANRMLGRYREAEKHYRKALTIRRGLASINPDKYLRQVSIVEHNLGILLSVRNWPQDLPESKRLLSSALATRRKLKVQNPDAFTFGVANTCGELANTLSKMGEFEEAETLHRESVATKKALYDSDSETYGYSYANSCRDLSATLIAIGKAGYSEAKELLEIGRAILEQYYYGENPRFGKELAETLEVEASLFIHGSAIDEGRSCLNRALSLWDDLACSNTEAYGRRARECERKIALVDSDIDKRKQLSIAPSRKSSISRAKTPCEIDWKSIDAADIDVLHYLANTNPEAKSEFLHDQSLPSPRNEYGNLDVEIARENIKTLDDIAQSIGSMASSSEEALALAVIAEAMSKNRFVIACHDYATTPEKRHKAKKEHERNNARLYGKPDADVFWALLNAEIARIEPGGLDDGEISAYRELLDLIGKIEPSGLEIEPPPESLVHETAEMARDFFGGFIRHIPADKETFTSSEVCEIANEILAEELYQQASGWHAEVIPDSTYASTDQDSKTVKFPGKRSRGLYTQDDVRAIMVHEIGVHVLRSIPYEQCSIAALYRGLPGYVAFEEGVAKAFEMAINGRYEASGVMHYISIGLADLQGRTFREVFEIQKRLALLTGSAPESVVFDSVQRAFRGTGALPNNKDLAYFNGSRKVWSFIGEHLEDPMLFDFLILSGKSDITDPIHARFVYDLKAGRML